MKFELKSLKLIIYCFAIGFINGLFGAGGGMLAVPMLKQCGLKQKQAHANSIAVILPLCCFSAVLYMLNNNTDFNLTLKLLPFGLAGAVIGTIIFKKINDKLLKKIFAFILFYAGVKMLIN